MAGGGVPAAKRRRVDPVGEERGGVAPSGVVPVASGGVLLLNSLAGTAMVHARVDGGCCLRCGVGCGAEGGPGKDVCGVQEGATAPVAYQVVRVQQQLARCGASRRPRLPATWRAKCGGRCGVRDDRWRAASHTSHHQLNCWYERKRESGMLTLKRCDQQGPYPLTLRH